MKCLFAIASVLHRWPSFFGTACTTTVGREFQTGKMLHETQVASCTAEVRFWNTHSGWKEFVKLVGTFVHPPPSHDDTEALRTLRMAVPPSLVVPSPEDVEQRVVDAARSVAERLRMSRKKTAEFYDFCSQPVPPRHSVYVGPSDRRTEFSDVELRVPMQTNPHFDRWRREHAR